MPSPITLTDVSPNSGYPAGGGSVILTGTGFQAGCTCSLGTVTSTSPISLQVTVDPHVIGTVDVTVTNTDTGFATLMQGFTYVSQPTITQIIPPHIGTGGTSPFDAEVVGTNFAPDSTVTVDGIPVSVIYGARNQLSFTAPPHAAGSVPVTVTNPTSGLSVTNNGLVFVIPTISSIVPPTSGLAGGITVQIFGSNFYDDGTPGAWVVTDVTFGGIPATIVAVFSSSHMECVIPAHAAATVDILMTGTPQFGIQGTAGAYTYEPFPTVLSVTPDNGSAFGGTRVTVHGTGFDSDAAVFFGGDAATDVVIISPTELTCVNPSHAAGAVTVEVTNVSVSQSGSLDGFIYTDTLTVSPTSLIAENHVFGFSPSCGDANHESESQVFTVTTNLGVWSVVTDADWVKAIRLDETHFRFSFTDPNNLGYSGRPLTGQYNALAMLIAGNLTVSIPIIFKVGYGDLLDGRTWRG